MTTSDPQRLLRDTAWLRALALELVGDSQSAEDVVQDTCVAALEHPPHSAASDVGLRAWLARVARNLAYLQARGERRRRARERQAARPESLPSVAEAVERVAVQREIVDAVLALDPADREVVVLRFFEDLPPRTIADRLGISGSAVRSRLSRALAKLRARLDQSQGGDERSWVVALVGLARHAPSRRPLAESVTGGLIVTGLSKSILAAAVVLAAAFVWVRLDPLGDGAADLPAVEALPSSAGELTDLGPLMSSGKDKPQGLVPRNEVEVSISGEASQRPADHPRLVVHGRFVDSENQPIPGVRLTAWEVHDRPWAESGSDGRVTLTMDWPLAVQNQMLLLVMAREGWTRHYHQEQLTGPGILELGDLRLAPGGAIVGFVRDPGGSPIAKARVRAAFAIWEAMQEDEERRVWARSMGLGQNLFVSAGTDETGAYRIEGVPLTRVLVIASAPGRYKAQTLPLQVERARDLRAPDLVLATLETANTIRGEVRDAHGQPIPGVQVRAYPNRDFPREIDLTRAPTDARGRFELPVVSGRAYTILVRVPEHLLGILRHDIPAGRQDLLIEVDDPRTLEIVVTDVTGEPVAEPSVELFDLEGGGIAMSPERGPGGLLVVPVPPVPFRLQVGSPAHLPASLGPFDPDVLPPELLVTLDSAGVLRGRVLAAGLPVAQARLHLHKPPQGARFARYADERFTELVEFFTELGPRTWQEVRSDTGGNFELPSPGAGTFVIHAEADGHGRGESQPVSLGSGESRAGFELELYPPSALFGRVIVAAGVEVQGTIVGVTRGDGHVRTQTVGRDGAYRFEGLAPGRWQVRRCTAAAQEGLRAGRIRPQEKMTALPYDVELPAGREVEFDLDLRDERPCRISGSLTFDGIPAEGWPVQLGVQGEQVLMHTDAEGRFQATLRRPGHGFLGTTSVSMPGQLVVVSRPVELVAGDNTCDLNFVTGSVSLSGLPPSPQETVGPFGAGYALRSVDPGDQTLWFVLFDPEQDGSRTLDGIPVGAVELHGRTVESQSTDPASWPRVETLYVEEGRRTEYAYSSDGR